MKKLFAIVPLLALLIGCADLNTTAFRLEKTAADLAAGSVHSFNVYYTGATNGASPAKVESLNKERDQVYDQSRKLFAILSVAENARLLYSTNSTPANAATLNQALSALNANSGSITGIVADAMAPYSTLELKGKP